MTKPRIKQIIEYLRQAISQPRDELDRWERAIRFTYDLGRYGARQLREDRAAQMAAALSFRTLFGLLPVLVVGTMLVKALGGFDQFRARLAELFGSFGLDRFHVQASANGEAAAAGGQSLSSWLLDLISQVQDINLAAITWVGVAVLIYSAVSLVVTIEGCFNNICRAPEGRAWTRRVPVYWTVITLAPLLIAVVMYLNNRLDVIITDTISWWWLLKIARLMWSLAATWLAMFAVYRLLPNANMRTQPAIIGACVAAVLLELGKRTMGLYFEHALSFRQLYGSLGLIPVFMFWVYLMWLIVLFGLEVSATLQRLAGRTLEEMEPRRRSTGLVDPAAILTLAEVVAERFGRSSTATAPEIADATGTPEAAVELMLRRLVEAGILHRVEGGEGAVSLARPPEKITADELMDVGFAMVDEGGGERQPAVLQRLRDAQRSMARELTLAGLLTPDAAARGER